MDTPSVSLLNIGETDTIKGEAVFAILITRIVQFFGAVWAPEQIKDCANVCFNEWYYLTFAELAHFAQKAKSGGFKEEGKSLVYGQFSPAVLIDWFCTYAAENFKDRGDYFGSKTQVKQWVEPENPVAPEQIAGLVAELQLQITEEKRKEQQESNERRDKVLKNYNDMLLKQAELKANSVKGKTERQVPDRQENVIPNETGCLDWDARHAEIRQPYKD